MPIIRSLVKLHYSHILLHTLNITCAVSDSLRHGVARQAPLSVGFSRQEYGSVWPCPPPGDREPSGLVSPVSYLLYWQAVSLPPARPAKPEHSATCSMYLAIK